MTQPEQPLGERSRSVPEQLYWSAEIGLRASLNLRVPFDEARLEAAERRRVGATVRHAFDHVPHWREAMSERGIEPGDIVSRSDLAALPVLERRTLQESPERLLPESTAASELVALRTGGTSGRPVAVYHDRRGMMRATIYAERARRIHARAAGRRMRLSRVSFGSGRAFGREIARVRVTPGGLRGRQSRLSVLDPVAVNCERVAELMPDMLSGYGSYVEMVIEHLADHRPDALPRIVRYGGDGMSERGLRMLSDLGIPVFSVYSSVEAPTLGFECEAHRGHHVNSDFCPVRVVDDAGRDVPAGELGEVVVSNLLARGTMILNYRLGDVARWVEGPCPCGRKLPLLSFIEGRVDDWLALPGGRTLHPQAVRTLFTEEAGLVRAYRVEHRGGLDFRLFVVAVDEGRDELAGRLRESLTETVGDDATIEVTYVDELPRTPSGKLRTVTSEGAVRTTGGASLSG